MAEDQADRADGDASAESIAMRRAVAQQARMKKLERLRSAGDSSLTGQVVHKVCCVCGTELSHRPRFKDAEGRYWCPDCNEIDHLKKQSVACAGCGVEMPRTELKEFGGELLCPVCMDRRRTDKGPIVAPAGRPAPPRPARRVENKGTRGWVATLSIIIGLLLAALVVLFVYGS